jgi:hypothetical protein
MVVTEAEGKGKGREGREECEERVVREMIRKSKGVRREEREPKEKDKELTLLLLQCDSEMFSIV